MTEADWLQDTKPQRRYYGQIDAGIARVPRTFASCPYFRRAFGWSVPIGSLAGLVGLGGGEFRLPVIMHSVGFDAKSAVPLNLLVSAVHPLRKISRQVQVSVALPPRGHLRQQVCHG